jgi:hypothetical protein
MNKTILRSTVFILSAALLAACAPKTQTTLSVPVSPPATLTDEPNPTAASVEPAPAPSADMQPAPAGEGWLLVNTEHGLWMGRPDGSQGALRITGPVIVPGPLPDALSPAEGLFAYLTTSDITGNFGNLPDLTLNVISLTGHGEAAAIPLTSPLTEPGGEFPSDIQRAMVEQKSFAWSPEGMRLAYIGAAQGPSADLYEYLRESGEAVQLTDGPDQAFAPQWSPDGLWIVHAAAATFGTGAGIGVTGVYAARADGRGAFSLYDIPQYSGNEELLGWLDTDTAVMRSWFATCGPSNLRLVNLSNETVDEVFGGCLSATAVGGGAVLLAQSPDTAMFDEDPRPGLFLLTAAGDRTPMLLTNDDVREAAWAEGAGVFIARAADSQLLEISLDGRVRTLPASLSRLPAVSPDGLAWAYTAWPFVDGTSGIFAGVYGTQPAQIFEGDVSPGQMFFAPDDALYFITVSGNLYRAQAPDWSPALLASGLTPASYEPAMAWMGE